MEPVKGMKPTDYAVKKGFEGVVSQGITLAEKKSDGHTLHVLVDRSANEPLRLFSSSLSECNPLAFPELVSDFEILPDGYFHGELLGRDATSMNGELEAVAGRSKKSVNQEKIAKHPLKVDIFDVLYKEHQSVMQTPYAERRDLLESILGGSTGSFQLVEQHVATSASALEKIYKDIVGVGFEGLVVKHPDSLYFPGTRTKDWLKLKGFATLDLALMGFFSTPESYAAGKPFAAGFGGVYNPETKMIESLSKFKISAKKDQEAIVQLLGNRIVSVEPEEAQQLAYDQGLLLDDRMYEGSHKNKKVPHTLVLNGDPLIVEVQYLRINKPKGSWTAAGKNGDFSYVLRSPTFKRIRDDKKGIIDVNTVGDLHENYVP